MFRTDFDISDEEFSAVVEPHNQAIDKYLKDNVVYDFVAYYLATGYKMGALWESSLLGHFNGAIESLCGVSFKNQSDVDELKEILKKKYGLIITNDNPLQFKEKSNIIKDIINKFFHKKRT